MSVSFERLQVVMPYETARGIALAARRQASTIERLRERLADRENLLMLALHELAILRQEREPQYFMYQSARRTPFHRNVPRNGRGAA